MQSAKCDTAFGRQRHLTGTAERETQGAKCEMLQHREHRAASSLRTQCAPCTPHRALRIVYRAPRLVRRVTQVPQVPLPIPPLFQRGGQEGISRRSALRTLRNQSHPRLPLKKGVNWREAASSCAGDSIRNPQSEIRNPQWPFPRPSPIRLFPFRISHFPLRTSLSLRASTACFPRSSDRTNRCGTSRTRRCARRCARRSSRAAPG
jgi:hypothetical protein